MKAVSNKINTIYDVAKKAGVSPATVSRVLNAPDTVAADKRMRVQNAIHELNFVPKAEAVAKARSLYRKVGVVAPFFTEPSFMERLRGIAKVLASKHFELVVYSIDTSEDLSNYIQLLVNTRRVDALILLCVKPEKEVLSILNDADFPVCFVEAVVEGFYSVAVPNLSGGKKAAEYLYSIGCRHPGFIGQSSDKGYSVGATEERYQGFVSYFEGQGIQIPDNYVWIKDFTSGELEEGIDSYLSQKDLPDSVFCSSDVIAARFIRIASSRGIKIPEDIKVIGFDNIDMSEHIGLTSVSQNLEESGVLAARMVLEGIENNSSAILNATVPVEVVERSSTGKK